MKIKKIGMIFPGQGAQFLGMGKDFYDQERVVQELFEEASACLDQNFTRLCFASSEKELRETINAQTSIFLISASIYTILNKKYGITPDLVAGHSSGEYAAIYAAGGMTFPDALYLLKKRSLFMEEATKNQNGGMLAVLGTTQEQLEKICKIYDPSQQVASQNTPDFAKATPGTHGECERVAEIVNYNSPQQLVVSGTLPELEEVKLAVKELKGKAIQLNVAGAFHSRLMQEPAENFGLYMVKVDFKDLSVPLINNLQAKSVCIAQDVKDSLAKQICSPVLWWQSMQQFKDMDLIIEVGPSDKLAKMLQREWPDKKIVSVSNMADLENLLKMLGKEIEKPEIDDSEPEEKVKDSTTPVSQVAEETRKQVEV